MRASAIACAGVALLLAAATARGHAVVTRSSLDGAPVRAGTPTRVAIRFNSTIEPRFTRVVLADAHGGERPLGAAPDAGAGEIAVELPALAPGRYALRYRVLATDGHVTENVIRFAVEP